jgi:uncharacterized protein YggU (UPF0235/DUF167 family)
VKVAAGAPHDAIDGWLGDVLKLRVAAPPERGKANAAVERLVADAMGVARSRVRIVAGHASPRKTLELSGVSESEVHTRLNASGRAS